MLFRVAAMSSCLAIVALAGCKREERNYNVPASASSTQSAPRLSALEPGPVATPSAAHGIRRPARFDDENNVYALSEGKRLYIAMNCKGCHAMGGGDIGPPLIDAKWIYGSEPQQIYQTIAEGRPNGMPAWGGKIPEYQIWQLVGYVRSMSGQISKSAAPSRSDHLKERPAENSTPTISPYNAPDTPVTRPAATTQGGQP